MFNKSTNTFFYVNFDELKNFQINIGMNVKISANLNKEN